MKIFFGVLAIGFFLLYVTTAEQPTTAPIWLFVAILCAIVGFTPTPNECAQKG